MSEEKFARRHIKHRLLEIERQAVELQKTARDALDIIADLNTIRILRWRCEVCGYVKSFSKPCRVEACGQCDKCKLCRWVPDGQDEPNSTRNL